jgi:hypothetical protein
MPSPANALWVAGRAKAIIRYSDTTTHRAQRSRPQGASLSKLAGPAPAPPALYYKKPSFYLEASIIRSVMTEVGAS